MSLYSSNIVIGWKRSCAAPQVAMDPALRARNWLQNHAKQFYSISDTGMVIRENFSQLLIHEVVGDLHLLNLECTGSKWNYFIGKPWGTTEVYPDDVDTTSYALKVLPNNDAMTVNSVLDAMLNPQQMTEGGIIKVYFDHTRNRTDPTVCINVLRLFFHNGRGSQQKLQKTINWIHDVLLHREYLGGTRYYHSAETFLYFLARLLYENPDSEVSYLRPLLRERLVERVNCEADTLGLAMRILASHYMEVTVSREMNRQRLLAAQDVDGSFIIGWLCRYGRNGMKIGSTALTTALALSALESA